MLLLFILIYFLSIFIILNNTFYFTHHINSYSTCFYFIVNFYFKRLLFLRVWSYCIDKNFFFLNIPVSFIQSENNPLHSVNKLNISLPALS